MKTNNNNQKTVVLGLSGGVDSAVAALLLKKQGYKVIGAFLKMYSDTKNPLTGECSYLEDKRDAQKIAILLKIPFVMFDFEKIYKKEVLQAMFNAYKKGLTPNPDISCNTIIKFPLLWKEAKKLGADYIATGHYARIKEDKNGFYLLAGKDKKKDQSYFLSGLTQQDLQHTLFPIGNFKKEDVRRIAKRNKFSNWNKHGTVGICFIGETNMQRFLKQKIKSKIGKVIGYEGKEIGTHLGIQFYTIGQKAGSHIGIDIKKPFGFEQKRFYVAKKLSNNILVVAPEGHSSLKKKEVILKDFYLINKLDKISGKLKARIRHLGQLHKGKLVKRKGKWHFIFEKGIEAVAEGQYIVIYEGDKVLGSGEIRLR